MRKYIKLYRGVAMLLAVLLALSAAAGAESFSAIGKDGGIRIYKDASLTQYWGTMPKNTVVVVDAYADGIAQVRYRGYTGYAPVADMDAVAQVAQKAVVTTGSRVFRYASTSSSSVAVPAGTEVYVLAVRGACAAVERKGYVGYMYTGHLSIGSESASAAEETAPEQEANTSSGSSGTVEDVFTSGKYTNEQLIYAFAVKVMGYNSAAACGLLANIKSESGFNPQQSGDSGTSIGICQWHAGRKTRLINWCNSNGYDYTTLMGQLYYLQYELKTYYPKVNNFLLSVGNDAAGAYEAGYYFCYNFEAPANRASKSDTRGTTASGIYYPKYASV